MDQRGGLAGSAFTLKCFWVAVTVGPLTRFGSWRRVLVCPLGHDFYMAMVVFETVEDV